jgi:LacI family transcriptional regulator
MAASIADVAAAAGVSRATASRALSGHAAVLPETRERVLGVARQLRYRADPVARALRAGSSNLLGLIVSNLQNPAIQEIAETVQALGQTEGYEVVIATTNDDGARERRLIEALANRRVDGLITMSSGENTELLNELHDGGLPIVELIRLPRGTRTPSVVYDDVAAGALATEHLLALGHRQIAFIGGPPTTRTGSERYAGFVAAHAASSSLVAEQLVARGPFSAAFGVEAVSSLLNAKVRPTALVIANHEAMFAALQALNREGVRIPKEMSVVAVEDDPLLAWWHPAITVVDVLPRSLATDAIETLIAQIRDEGTSLSPSVTVGVGLTNRASAIAREGAAQRRP